LFKYHAIGSSDIARAFVDLMLDDGWWAGRGGEFPIGMHCIAGWRSPRANLDHGIQNEPLHCSGIENRSSIS